MQSFFNNQNNFHPCQNIFFPLLINNQNPNFQELNQISKQVDVLNINSETYFFNRKKKSRFFNKNDIEEEKKIDFESISTNSDSFSGKSDIENNNLNKKEKHDVMEIKQNNKKKKKMFDKKRKKR